MSTTKKRKSPITLAIAKDNVPYLRVRDCGISPLVVMIDGLPLTFFGKGKTAYLKVQTVLEWFEKEATYCPKNELYKQAAAKCREILEDHAVGKIPCH